MGSKKKKCTNIKAKRRRNKKKDKVHSIGISLVHQLQIEMGTQYNLHMGWGALNIFSSSSFSLIFFFFFFDVANS